MKKIYQYVKDYFTANSCRKIFFFGLVLALFLGILNFFVREYAVTLLLEFIILFTVAVSMADDMITRNEFLKKIREMQYAHIQEIIDKQEAGQDVAVTPTFSPEEKKYLRRKKSGFLIRIIFKMMLVLVLMFLLFS